MTSYVVGQSEALLVLCSTQLIVLNVMSAIEAVAKELYIDVICSCLL